MTFSKGSLILVDYTAWVRDTKEVFDTTSAAEAERNQIYDKNAHYHSKLVSVNDVSYPVLKGLDEALAGMSVGDELTVEVEHDKAFGQRDSGKIRMIPRRKLGDDADKVSVGDTVEVDKKKGIIRYIGSGRVQIDYNHKYAGKTVVYHVSVVRSLDTDDDKVGVILENHLPLEDSEIAYNLKDNVLTVQIPEKIHKADGLQTTKHQIQVNVFKFVPTLERINFVETHLNQAVQGDTPAAHRYRQPPESAGASTRDTAQDTPTAHRYRRPPQPTEPDSTEPTQSQPDSTEPDSTEPTQSQPDSTEPDSTEPDSTEPTQSQPDSTEPDSKQP